MCKCNPSIKNLKFDQIAPVFSSSSKNDTAQFDYMFDPMKILRNEFWKKFEDDDFYDEEVYYDFWSNEVLKITAKDLNLRMMTFLSLFTFKCLLDKMSKTR